MTPAKSKRQTKEELLQENEILKHRLMELEGSLTSSQRTATGATNSLPTDIPLQEYYLQKVRDAVVASDKDYQVLYWNAAAETIYGWRSEEVLGKDVKQLLQTQTNRPFNKERYHEIVHKDKFWFGEVTQLKKDGTRFPCEISVTILYDENNNISGYVSVNRDISERKLAEEMFHGLAEAAPDGIFMVGLDGKIVLVNSQAETMFGYTREDLLGKSVEELMPENLRAVHQSHRESYSAKPFTRQMGSHLELFAQRKDGSQFPVEISLNPLDVRGGRVIAVIVRDMTEQKHAKQELLQSEEKFASAFEYAAIGKALVALDGYFLKVNNSICKMLGYSPKEFLAKSFQDITHPDDLEADLAHVADMRAGHIKTYQMEKRYIHKDGHLVWASLSVSMVRESDGAPSFFISKIQDITERKLAEDKISQQLKRLTTLRKIEQAIAGSMNVHWVLSVALQHLLTELSVDASVVLLIDPVEQTLKYEFGLGLRSPALKYTHLHLGEGFAGKAALTKQMVYIEDLKNKGIDFQRSPTFSTEGFISYFGIPLIAKGEVVGVLEIFHRSQIQPKPEWLDFMGSLAGQIAIAIDNARLWKRVQQHALDLELRVEERTAELHRLNLELQHANHAKDEFLANMSHELRTPLNSILGFSESLLEQRRGPINKKQEQYIELIHSSGEHLLNLINDILQVSKIEAGKFEIRPEFVFVKDVCESSLNFVKEAAMKKSISLEYQNESSISTLWADSQRLKQILVNLLSNAVKFTPAYGSVSLEVQTNAEKDRILFSVKDNGIGISKENIKKLFTPFTQLDSDLSRQYEGTGLGLVLVYKLTELHGGSVAVESEPGKGSQFTVTLPWSENEPQSQKEEMQSGPADDVNISEVSAKKHSRILLAEDNETNIMAIQEYLMDRGHEVVIAHNGQEAIMRAKELSPDLILMDIQMPEMDGLEAIQQLRLNTRFATTPIIALTALAMPGDRERCLKAGANEYMSKPVRLKDLAETINNLLQSKNT
ncbi:MAG: PAS domain S-box protein [Anaerolineales bacterium]|nr:PAS domain S-box protein [Anaerolineales bacterium]